jgi:hypothetical protein
VNPSQRKKKRRGGGREERRKEGRKKWRESVTAFYLFKTGNSCLWHEVQNKKGAEWPVGLLAQKQALWSVSSRDHFPTGDSLMLISCRGIQAVGKGSRGRGICGGDEGGDNQDSRPTGLPRVWSDRVDSTACGHLPATWYSGNSRIPGRREAYVFFFFFC